MKAMSESLYLCLDQGGSSSRAMVFGARGELVAMEQQALEEFRSATDRVEQDPRQLLSSLQACAEAVIDKLSAPQCERLVSAGLITQRSSLVCFQRDTGEPLSPVLSWQDTRAKGLLPTTSSIIGDIYQRTGLRANGHFSATKMRWCLDHIDAVNRAAQAGNLVLAPLACFLSFHLLTARPCVVDRGNASRTLLMNCNTGKWDEVLLSLFAIDEQYLPQLIDSDALIGELALKRLSLPMRLLTGDQCAASFANGVLADNSARVNLGTGAFILTPEPAPSIRNGQLNSIVHWHGSGTYMIEATVNGAGVALALMAEKLLIVDPIAELALAMLSRESPPLFINTISGLGSPDWRNDIESFFVDDQGCSNTLRLLAVAESVLFLIVRNLQLLVSVKPQLTSIHVSGGLSESNGLCQRLSDLSGMRVCRSPCIEASGVGAAFLLSDDKFNWPVIKGDVFNTQPNMALQQRYQRWLQCLEQALA